MNISKKTAHIIFTILMFLPVGTLYATTGSIGVTSNYVFRGDSRSNDQLAIQGGAEFGSSLYGGIWASQVGNGTASGLEMDGYVGLRGKLFGPLGFDLGGVSYQFTNNVYTSFTEYYLGFTVSKASLKIFNNTNGGSYTDFRAMWGFGGAMMMFHFGSNSGGTDFKLEASEELIGLMFSAAATYENRGTSTTKIFVGAKKEF